MSEGGKRGQKRQEMDENDEGEQRGGGVMGGRWRRKEGRRRGRGRDQRGMETNDSTQ